MITDHIFSKFKISNYQKDKLAVKLNYFVNISGLIMMALAGILLVVIFVSSIIHSL